MITLIILFVKNTKITILLKLRSQEVFVLMNNLKDGYYISIYSCVNKYLNNYESCLRHDHNMSLWKKTK